MSTYANSFNRNTTRTATRTATRNVSSRDEFLNGNQGNGNFFDSQDQEHVNNQKPSEFFANIGCIVTEELEDGSVAERFITLPYVKGTLPGIKLDTLQLANIPNNDSEYRDIVIAQNNLLSEIMEIAHSLEPGQSTVLSAVVAVEIRRAGIKTTEVSEDTEIRFKPKGSLLRK